MDRPPAGRGGPRDGHIVAVAAVAREAAGGRAAVGAAALAAVFPAFVARDASVHSETLFALLVALALLAALRVARRPSVAGLVALGAIIGLAALTRSEGILLLVLLALPAVWRAGPRRVRGLAVVVLATGVVLAPWLVRCWTAFDRPVALTTSTGDLLAGANCDATYRGSLIGEWAFNCVLGAPGRDEVAVAARLRARGTRYARAHRGRLPARRGGACAAPVGSLPHPDQEVRLQASAGGGPRWLGWSGLVALWLLSRSPSWAPSACAGSGPARSCSCSRRSRSWSSRR